MTARPLSNAKVALVCAAVATAMVGAGFASVPLYRAFCQATGFAGAVRRGAPPATRQGAGTAGSSRLVTVRFDTNVRGLPWTFAPAQASQTLHPGDTKLAFFQATNTGEAAVTGRAIYNVVPQSAGPYFSKLECFCFKNQTIAPGETVRFPVVYLVDARYGNDADTRGAPDITLSYTFFPAATAAAG